MDESDKNIRFDEHGKCNHCLDSDHNLSRHIFSDEEVKKNLNDLFSKINKEKTNSKYDSIIGLSGGIDSTYVAYLAHQYGLNPLCIHLDNGWNSSTAIKNIKKVIDYTGYDLHTEVINWPEFRDLQRSFILSGVIDIEMLTDHAIFSTLCSKLKDFKIKSVLSGFNYNSEHGMPLLWIWSKLDFKNIKSIQNKFGTKKIKFFPHMNSIKWLLIQRFNLSGSFYHPLNLINYNRSEAKDILKKSFDWEDYGGKHYDSIFTKFYQSYILPKKFKVDKRKVYLSCKIRTKQITREDAFVLIKEPLYTELNLRKDKKFVLKKLGFTENEFNIIIKKNPVKHSFYKSDQYYIRPLIKYGKLLLGNNK